MNFTNWKAEVENEDTTVSAGSSSGNDSNSSDNNRVESSNNTIYFYSEVSRPHILTLNKSISNLQVNLTNRAYTLGNEDPGSIFLKINSYGGSVFAGFAAVDYIKGSEVPVCTIIEGCAASAATIMSVVGARRQIREHSFMLIHQLSSGMWGKYSELQDDMKNSDLLMKTIKNIYIEHTKIPKAQLAKMLKHDLWWDAKTCLKYGLVDEIV